MYGEAKRGAESGNFWETSAPLHNETLTGVAAAVIAAASCMPPREGKTTGRNPQNHRRTTKNRGSTLNFAQEPWFNRGFGGEGRVVLPIP